MAAPWTFKCINACLGKPYEMMISGYAYRSNEVLPEDGSLELTSGWTSDVKYRSLKRLTHTE